MKFIVDRKKWYRGRGVVKSKLLRVDGKMCCIGFVGIQCGIEPSLLLNKGTVEKVSLPRSLWPTWFFSSVDNTLDGDAPWICSDLNRAYEINDATYLTDAEREARLRAIFASHGDEIVFVD